MLEPVRPARVEPIHHRARAAERAKAHAAADIFAERRHVGGDAVRLLQPARREARGHHLVEDQHRAGLARQRAQIGEEFARRRDAAAAAEHRLDQDRREVAPVRLDQRAGAGDVVIVGEQEVERRVDRAALAAEIEDAAVIAAIEDEDLVAAGDCPRRRDRHQIGLGAAIGEAYEIDRRKAVADRRGEPRLGGAMRAEIDAAVERLVDRAADRRMRMAENPGGKLAEEIDVFVAVESHRRDPSPFAIVSGNGST